MIISMFAAAALAAADAPPVLRSGLEPLGFLVGHCWRGAFDRTGQHDTHCFESVYGGQHIRDRHEVTGGESVYAGETFYSTDGSDGVAFTYFNSLGGVSRGTMRPAPDGLNFGDEHYRGPDGREITLSVSWRRVGDDAYEVVTRSQDAPSMNGTVTYRRVPPAVAVSETRAPDGTLMLVHETVIDAPVTQVWSAIATPEGWRTWAVPVAWVPEGEPDIIETSYTAGAAPGDPSTIRQRVLARVPGRMIAFRTVKAPDGFPHFDIFGRTTGVFELEPAGEGRTSIRLVGAGYPDNEVGRQLIGFFREGNRISLERLRQRFVSGPVDWSRVGSGQGASQ
jgi:uncharacterized protein YndB with AHSA1/START domain